MEQTRAQAQAQEALGEAPHVPPTDDLETGSAPAGAGSWEFNDEVAARFEDMLARSIPNYDDMRRAVTDSACWLLDRWGKGGKVIDVGCSRGTALRPIVDRIGVRANYWGLELSEPMVKAARQEFSGWESILSIREHDLRNGLPDDIPPVQVVLSVLTLQFVPIEYRMRLLGDIYRKLSVGGGLVLVEKVLAPSPLLQEMEADLYHGMKRGQGYSQEAIERKALALEGRLVPVTAYFNEQMLEGAGFRHVDCIWAWANFRGWVALKEE